MAPLEMLLPPSAAVAPNYLFATGGKRPNQSKKASILVTITAMAHGWLSTTILLS